MTEPAIGVVGAGVIGLSSAITLAEAGHAVRVLSADNLLSTTSAAAGAIWGPWLVEPRRRVLPWAQTTLAVLNQLSSDPETGVVIRQGTEISQGEHPPPDWSSMQADREQIAAADLPPGYMSGTRYSAPVVDMPRYLDYLTSRLMAAGATIVQRRLTSLNDLDVDLVVNCSGLGAVDLVPDDDMYPIRGYQIVVPNPGITEFLEADTGDSTDLIAIHPHRDHLVLGGTAEIDNWNRQPDDAIAKAILSRCAHLEPRIEGLPILQHRVGLRPTRSQIRLEALGNGSGRPVVHNYGHGGAGVSLSWGCAHETRILVETALSRIND